MTDAASPPPDVLCAYGVNLPARRFGSGLINDTFLVDIAGDKAVLQRLHTAFGPSVHEDIDAVTTHLERRGLTTPRLVRTLAGGHFVVVDGRCWRALTFIDGHSIDRVDSPARAHEAGRLVGRFHLATSDLVHSYRHVRPGVHDTAKHLDNLRQAIAGASDHRLGHDVIAAAARLFAAAEVLPSLLACPKRHAHGDLKISNLLFDDDKRGLCLVDLDTLSFMAWPHEMGDALRSWCNPAGEDVANAELDAQVFSAAVAGYAEATQDLISRVEWDLLVWGLATICLELASRFLADALQERYFGFDRSRFDKSGEHNLLRGRGQLALGLNVLARRDDLGRMVRELP